ncbi:MAG: recombination regulator RecX, partial [Proteobacteria bacterium]|nr:recombination regulator RecX [Pseudomonadota bacterium]
MSAELRAQALRLLARRDHSRAELRRKLAARAESAEELDRLLDELAAGKLLSDARYAEQRAGLRGRRLGNARLAQELRTAGVAAELIVDALDAAGDEAARAQAVWQKKFGCLPADRGEWAKQARFLQARG